MRIALTKSGAAIFTLIAMCWPFVICDGLATEPVPFVGCGGDGQTGPVAAPKGDPRVVDVDAADARKLAYYQASDFPGVLAPKGWHCFYRYGSSGGTLLVAPISDIEKMSDARLDSPAVVVSLSFGGTSGRFAVAMSAARLYPQEEREFIKRVIDEAIVPKEDFRFGPYPGDILTYRNARIAEFTTPANQEGLGTSGRLAKSSQPIYGIVALLGPSEEPDLLTLTVRLPPEMRRLRSTIIANFEPIDRQADPQR